MRAALYEDSLKRLRKRGLSEDKARVVADKVAERAAERTKVPEFDSQAELGRAVHHVCGSLSEGKSYYDVIGELPYLATGRIDRLVAAAPRVSPEVPAEMALAAKRATMLERLSGSTAVLFTGVALASLNVWYALAIGVFVSAGTELYVQVGMPKKARQIAARYRLTLLLGAAALVTLVSTAYSWLGGQEYAVWKGLGLGLFAMLVVAVIPGLTLAVLVGVRERRWRFALERELAAAESDGRSEDD